MRSLAKLAACFVLSAGCPATTLAQAPEVNQKETIAKQRMDLMRQRAEALTIVGPRGEGIECSKRPLLRYSDAARDIVDASLWAIGEQGRPRAVLVLEVYQNSYVQYEFTSLANPPSKVVAARLRWAPQNTNFGWSRIPDAPAPHDSKRTRLRQMKQLARRFAASEEYRGQTYQLRLMPQPIYDYDNDQRGVLDGAIFVIAHGTNVEILMTVEARQNQDGKRHWQAGFSRLGAATLTVTYRDQPFWSSAANQIVGPSASYYYGGEQLSAKERSVFE